MCAHATKAHHSCVRPRTCAQNDGHAGERVGVARGGERADGVVDKRSDAKARACVGQSCAKHAHHVAAHAVHKRKALRPPEQRARVKRRLRTGERKRKAQRAYGLTPCERDHALCDESKQRFASSNQELRRDRNLFGLKDAVTAIQQGATQASQASARGRSGASARRTSTPAMEPATSESVRRSTRKLVPPRSSAYHAPRSDLTTRQGKRLTAAECSAQSMQAGGVQ